MDNYYIKHQIQDKIWYPVDDLIWSEVDGSIRDKINHGVTYRVEEITNIAMFNIMDMANEE